MSEENENLLSDQDQGISEKSNLEKSGKKPQKKELDEIDVLKELLETCQNQLNENKIEMIKKDFDNAQLMQRITIVENLLPESKQKMKPELELVLTSDIFLNYNNKQNYIDRLHEKIQEMNDLLQGHNYSQKSKQQTELTYRFEVLKDKHTRLREIYLLNKKKRKKLQQIKEDFEDILPQAIKMRTILKQYYNEGSINVNDLTDLYLDEQNRILDVQLQSGEKADQQGEENKELQDSIFIQYKESTRLEILKTLVTKTRMIKKIKKKQNKDLKKQIEKENQFQKQIEEIKRNHEQEIKEMRDGFTKKIESIAKNYQNSLKNQQNMLKASEMQRQSQLRTISENQSNILKASRMTNEVLAPKMNVQGKEIKTLKAKLAKAQQQIVYLREQRTALLNKSQQQAIQQQPQQENPEKQMSNKANLLLTRLEFMSKQNILTKRHMKNIYNLNQQVDLLKKENNDLLNEIQDYENDYEKIEQENFELIQKNGKLEGMLEIYQGNTEGNDVAQLMLKIEELNDQVAKLKGENGVLNNEVLYLNTLLDDKISAKNDEEKIEILENFQKLQQKFNDQKIQIQDYKFQLQDYREKLIENKLLDEEEDDEELKNPIYQEELVKILENYKVEEKEITLFKNYFKEQERLQQQKDLKIENQQSEIEIQSKKIKIFLRDMKNLTESKLQFYQDQYKSQLDSVIVQSKMAPKKSTIFNQDEAIQNMREEAEQKNQIIEAQKQEIESLFKTISEQEKEQGRLLKELLELRKYKKVIDDIKRNEANYIKLKNENKGLIEEIDISDQRLKKKDQELKEAQDRFKDYDSNLQKKEKKILDLQNQIQEIKVQEFYKGLLSEASDQKIQELQAEVSRLKKIINDYKLKEASKENQIDKQKLIQKIQPSFKVQLLKEEIKQLKEKVQENKNEIKQKNKEILTFKESSKNISQASSQIVELEFKLSKFKKIVQSRDIEIIELIKDSNKKTDQLIQLKQIAGISDEQFMSIQKITENSPNSLMNKNNLDGFIYNQLEQYRQTFHIQQRGDEEKLILYRKLEYKNLLNNQNQNSQDFNFSNNNEQIKDFQSRQNELEQIINSKEIQINSLNQNLKELKSQNEELQQKFETQLKKQQIQEIEVLEYKEKQLQQEFICKEQQIDLDNLRKSSLNLNKKANNDQKIINELKLENNDQKNQIIQLEDQINKLKLQQEKQNSKIEVLENEIDQLQEEIIDNTEEFLIKINAIDENKFEKMQKIEKLELENAQLQKKYTNLKNNFKNVKEFEELANIEINKKAQNFTPQAMLKFVQETKQEKIIEEKNDEIIQLKQKIILLENQSQNKSKLRDSQIQDSTLSDLENSNFNKNQFLTRSRKVQRTDHELCDQQIKNQTQKINQLNQKIESLQKISNQYLEMIKDKNQEQNLHEKFVTSVQPLQIPHQSNDKQIESLKGQNQRLHDLKRNLQRENYELKEVLQKQESEIKLLNQTLQMQDAQLQDYKNKLGTLELEKNTQLDEKNLKYIQMLDDKDKYYRKIIENKEKELEQLDVLKKTKTEQLEKIQSLEKQNKLLNLETEKTEQKFSLSKQKADEFQKLYNEVKDALNQSKKDQQQLLNQIQDLKEKISVIEQENQESQQKSSESEQIIKELNQKIKSRDQRIKELQIDIQKNEEFYLKNQKFHEEEETKILLRKKDRKILELQQKVQRNTDLELELDTMRKAMIQHDLDSQSNKNKIFKLEQEIIKKNEELDQKEISLNQLKKDKKIILEQSDNRKQGQQKLQEMKKQLQEQNKNLQLEMQALINDRNFLEMENEKIQEQFELDFKNFKITLEEKMREMNFFKQQKNKKIDQLKKDNEILTFANEDLYSQLEQLRGKNVDLVAKQK